MNAALSFAMFYTVMTWCARRALRWCYAEVTMVGHVPAHGPVLLAVNHPNDLADICVVLSQVPRRVVFVANVSATEHPVVKLAYEAMGVIPVHRVRDVRRARARGEDSEAANAVAMERVLHALREGACVVFFPEGGVNRGPHLVALRTGLARMVLAARDAGVRGVQLVPLGITYEASNTMHTRVLGHVGDPIDVETWQAHPDRPAAPQLTAALATRLRAVTRNAPDERAHAALSAMADVVAATAPEGVPPLLAANDAWRALTTEIYGEGVQAEVADDPRCAPALAVREALQSQADAPLSRLLGAWGRRDARSMWTRVADGVLGPLGWTLHAPAWWALDRLAAQAGASSDRMARRIVPGLYVMAGWYVAVALVAVVLAALLGTGVLRWVVPAAAIALMPRLGDAAARWQQRRQDDALRKDVEAHLPETSVHLALARAAVNAAAQSPPSRATSNHRR